MDGPAVPWAEIAAVLFRRWKLMVTVFAAGSLAFAVLASLRGPTYQAAAKLMITSERPRMTVSPDADTKPSIDRVTEQDLNSEVELLQSTILVREALEPYRQRVEHGDPPGLVERLLGWARLPLDLPRTLYRRFHGIPPQGAFEQWVERSASRVSVTPLSKSNLIEVSYEDSKPAWAAEFVNQLVSRHVERHVQLNQQSDARRFFETQQALLSTKLNKAEKALRRFYEREGIDSVPEQRSLLRTRLGDLELSLSQASTELAEANARSESLNEQIQTYPKSVATETKLAQSEGFQLVKSRILALELQRSELLSKFAPTSLKIRDVDRQIADAERLLAQEQRSASVSGRTANPLHQALEVDLAQTQARIAALSARVEALKSQVTQHRGEIEHLDDIASEQEGLEREVATAKTSFLTYLKKEEEARFADALDESKIMNVTVVEPAVVPAAPVPSKALLNILVGMTLSLFAGIAAAFLRDRLDPSVKSAADAHRLTSLPVLADIPW